MYVGRWWKAACACAAAAVGVPGLLAVTSSPASAAPHATPAPAVATSAGSVAGPVPARRVAPVLRLPNGRQWVAAWGSAMEKAEPVLGADLTCRYIARVTVAGHALRVHLSNEFVGEATTFDRVTIARRSAGGSIVSGSTRVLDFGGQERVTLDAGADVVSDIVAMRVHAGEDLAVSVHTSGTVVARPIHPRGLITSYCTDFASPGPDHTGDLSEDAFVVQDPSVSWVTGIDVAADQRAAAVVTFGDSLTDGYGATVDGFDRWPDLLERRLAGRQLAVVNAGIAGNAIAQRGWKGVRGVERLSRDALTRSGARFLVLFEGSNDVTGGADALTVIRALSRASTVAHSAGLRVVAATLIPRAGGWRGDDDAKESVRQAVNLWIRTTAIVDGVVDFDEAVRERWAPQRLRARFDSGDHVHPNAAGYAAMAAAFDMRLFN